MAATRIFRWADAPLAFRLMLAHATEDPSDRTHLAIIPAAARSAWEAEELPVVWLDVLRADVEENTGLLGVRAGDLLLAGNEAVSEST